MWRLRVVEPALLSALARESANAHGSACAGLVRFPVRLKDLRPLLTVAVAVSSEPGGGLVPVLLRTLQRPGQDLQGSLVGHWTALSSVITTMRERVSQGAV